GSMIHLAAADPQGESAFGLLPETSRMAGVEGCGLASSRHDRDAGRESRLSIPAQAGLEGGGIRPGWGPGRLVAEIRAQSHQARFVGMRQPLPRIDAESDARGHRPNL